MTLSDVSTGNKDAVSSLFKGLENVRWSEHAGAHQPNQPDARRVLHSTNACQISPRIGAPVARESYDLGIKVLVHSYSTGQSYPDTGSWQHKSSHRAPDFQ